MGASDVQDVEQLFRQFVAAFNAGDLETLRSSYTEDALVIPPGQPAVQGREAIISQLWGPMFETVSPAATLCSSRDAGWFRPASSPSAEIHVARIRSCLPPFGIGPERDSSPSVAPHAAQQAFATAA